jgi:pyruvate dehydrogenase E1 component
VEWLVLEALRHIQDSEHGRAVYLRLSTKVVEQALLEPTLARLGPSALRTAVLRGGYRLVDHRERDDYEPGANVVNLAAVGVMVPEAVAASRLLEADGIYANVLALTSPRRAYDDWQAARATPAGDAGARPRAWVRQLVSADELEGEVPVVSVLDGHSHALAWLGSALGVPQVPLGVHGFGQSGARDDLYRHYGIDPEAIAAAARQALG